MLKKEDREIAEIRGMFGEIMRNQERAKSKHDEGYSRRRNYSRDHHSQIEEV